MARHTALRHHPASSRHTSTSMAAHSDRTDRQPLHAIINARTYTPVNLPPPSHGAAPAVMSRAVRCGKMQCCVV